MTKTTWTLPVTLLLVLAAMAARGATPLVPGLPVSPGGLEKEGVVVRADWFGREGTTLYAVGNVRLARGKAVVTADAAVVWPDQREAYLEGNVLYRMGRTSVNTSRAYVHWSVTVDAVTGKAQTDMDRAFFINGDIRWHETPTDVAWRVRADEILQTDVLHFVARGNAFVTPNTFHRPHSYFRAKEIELIVDERLVLNRLTYHVQGVALSPSWQGWWIPPTYWPQLYVPLSWEWPEMSFDFGDSQRLGTYLRTRVVYDVPEGLVPFVESKVGVNMDYYSKRGFAYGADLRYRYLDAAQGRLDFYNVPSDSGDDFDEFENGTTDRFRARFQHMHDVIAPDGTQGWEADAELQHYSDAGFRREFFYSDYEEEKPIEDRLYFKYFDGPFAAYAHARWQGDEWVDTTEYLPQIGANVFSLPIWGGLVYTGHVELAYVRRQLSNLRMPSDMPLMYSPGAVDPEDEDSDRNRDDLEKWEDLRDRDDLETILGTDDSFVNRLRDENFSYFPIRSTPADEEADGADFWRFNTYHELALPFEAGIFDIEPFVGTRQTYYGESIGGGNEWRSIFLLGGRASTQFYTTWDNAQADALRLFGTRLMPLEIKGLRHIITPEFRLLHAFKPSAGPDELLPTDDTDVLQPIADAKYRHFPRRYNPRDPVGIAFGDVDAVEGVTTLSLGLRNRWQTRREQIIFTEDVLAKEDNERTPEEIAALPEVIRREFIVNFLDIDAEINVHSFDRDPHFRDDLDEMSSTLITGIEPPETDDFGDQIVELRLDTRFNPYTGVTVYNDFELNLANGGSADEGMGAFNTGLRINTSEWWELILMQRFELNEANRYGARISIVPCPKWRISMQYVYDTERGEGVDTSFHITRDLRDWVAEAGFESDDELGYEMLALRLRPKMSKRELISGLYFSRQLGAGAFGDGSENYVQYDY
ncbi:hypothetical protein HQ576_13265 [bacterium]|nr:hypothetical protein [bacterium]